MQQERSQQLFSQQHRLLAHSVDGLLMAGGRIQMPCCRRPYTVSPLSPSNPYLHRQPSAVCVVQHATLQGQGLGLGTAVTYTEAEKVTTG